MGEKKCWSEQISVKTTCFVVRRLVIFCPELFKRAVELPGPSATCPESFTMGGARLRLLLRLHLSSQGKQNVPHKLQLIKTTSYEVAPTSLQTATKDKGRV
jgi:hypothetical protein